RGEEQPAVHQQPVLAAVDGEAVHPHLAEAAQRDEAHGRWVGQEGSRAAAWTRRARSLGGRSGGCNSPSIRAATAHGGSPAGVLCERGATGADGTPGSPRPAPQSAAA